MTKPNFYSLRRPEKTVPQTVALVALVGNVVVAVGNDVHVVGNGVVADGMVGVAVGNAVAVVGTAVVAVGNAKVSAALLGFLISSTLSWNLVEDPVKISSQQF